MQYFVVFTPKKRFEIFDMPADFPKLLSQEEARAKELYGQGLIRQSWVLGKRDKGAACLFEAESPKHLQEMIDSFPLIKASYSDYEIFPLAPAPVVAKRYRSKSALS